MDQKPKVLVVENDDAVRAAIAELLRDEFLVLTAASAGDALFLLLHNRDVCVVTTSTLRGQRINGFCLAQKIRDNYQWAKVVLVTGGGSEGVSSHVRECFSLIVHKPFLSSLIPGIKFLLI